MIAALLTAPLLLAMVTAATTSQSAFGANQPTATSIVATSDQFFNPGPMKSFVAGVDCIFLRNCRVSSSTIQSNRGEFDYPAAGGALTGKSHLVVQVNFTQDVTNSQGSTHTISCSNVTTLDIKFLGRFDGHSIFTGTATTASSGGSGGRCGGTHGGGSISWSASLNGGTITGTVKDKRTSFAFHLQVSGHQTTGTSPTSLAPRDPQRELAYVLSTWDVTKALRNILQSSTDCGTGTSAPGPICAAALAASTKAVDDLSQRYGTAVTSLEKQMNNLWQTVSFVADLKDKNGNQADAGLVDAALTIGKFVASAEKSERGHTANGHANAKKNAAAAENLYLLIQSVTGEVCILQPGGHCPA
jgi:hypothetical protein